MSLPFKVCLVGGTLGWMVLFTLTGQAQTLTTIHSFTSTDGAYPYAALIQDLNGSVYGTTYGGGNGTGTIFQRTASGSLITLHTFAAGGTDGAYPYAPLVPG